MLFNRLYFSIKELHYKFFDETSYKLKRICLTHLNVEVVSFPLELAAGNIKNYGNSLRFDENIFIEKIISDFKRCNFRTKQIYF